jgi:non-specific serine/threonine protein kinase
MDAGAESEDLAAGAAVGATLRRHRLAAGLTQEALAERAGLGVRTLQGLEEGEHRPRRETLRRLAGALGLSDAQRARLAAAAPPAPRPARRPRAALRLVPPVPPTPGPGASLTNLPLQLTSFVGRKRELAAVGAALAGHRLVTLTGPAGVGKTRLALQAATAALEAHPDGVWLAELGGLADPDLVPQAVAEAAGVREERGRPLAATLADALRERRLLLVLDNCEHLVDACAAVAEALLRAGPGVRVLATSRAPLGAGGEALYPVPPLGLPPAGDGAPGGPGAPAGWAQADHAEAVRLFADRAAAARPGFAVTPENAAAVAQVCLRLDGLPLALELAAARVRALAVGDLAAQLEDRFRLLTGGSRTAPARRRTLRAAVDWSYALLSGPERALFARLSVFAGGFSLAAAEAVGAYPADRDPEAGPGLAAHDVLGLLLGLVDQSLVMAEPLPDGTTRYRLLETLRQYAGEALEASGAAEAVRARHAEHFLATVEAAKLPLWGPERATARRRLAAERDNLRAALGWRFERGHGAEGLRLALALVPFWREYGKREGQGWLEAALARGGAAPAALRAGATTAAGFLAAWRGDHDRALALGEAAVALAREQADRRVLAAALQTLGLAVGTGAGGDTERAAALFGESLALSRELGDEREVAVVHFHLAQLAHLQGQPERAVALAEEGLALSRRLGPGAAGSTALGLRRLGVLAYLQGQPDRAAGLVRQALARYRDLANAEGVAQCLSYLALLASAQGQAARAARLFGAAERQHESLQEDVAPPGARFRDDFDRRVAAARAALGERAYAAAWAVGRGMALEQAVAYALGPAPERGETGCEDPPPHPAMAAGATARQGPERPAPRGGLTAREREVAALVAQGRTNRQIADALGVSQRTAENHVNRILAKLGARSRARIAAWAAEQGLTQHEPRSMDG